MAESDTSPSTESSESAREAVAAHPLASKMQRAIQAHPILKLQKKLEVQLEGQQVIVRGTVYTINMLTQVRELAAQVAGEDATIQVDAVAEIQPPAGRELEGRVPPVSPGAGATKSDFSTNHLRK